MYYFISQETTTTYTTLLHNMAHWTLCHISELQGSRVGTALAWLMKNSEPIFCYQFLHNRTPNKYLPSLTQLARGSGFLGCEGEPPKSLPKKTNCKGTNLEPTKNGMNLNTAKRNMSSAVYASSMYSRLCMKMWSFLFVRVWATPRILYLSYGIPFPVLTPGIISGLTWGGERGKKKLEGRANFWSRLHFY